MALPSVFLMPGFDNKPPDRFHRQLRNELGRRYLEHRHLRALEGWSGARAAEALLRAAVEMEGRHKENATRMLLRYQGELTEGEYHCWVVLVLKGEDTALQEALLHTDRLLARPRLVDSEREALREKLLGARP